MIYLQTALLFVIALSLVAIALELAPQVTDVLFILAGFFGGIAGFIWLVWWFYKNTVMS